MAIENWWRICHARSEAPSLRLAWKLAHALWCRGLSLGLGSLDGVSTAH
jgi:hypothetical protein